MALLLASTLAIPRPSPAPLTNGLRPWVAGSAVTLAVDPARLSLVPGASASLVGVWSGVPANCVGTALWFRWSSGPGLFSGTLAPLNASSVRLEATLPAPSVGEARLDSALAIRCGSNQSVIEDVATASVSVMAPLEIANLSAAPDPVAALAPVVLSGWIVGGAPPLRLTVGWGDGTLTVVNLTSAGRFSLVHAFSAGSFAPTVIVVGAEGQQASATVDEPVYASAGLAVGIGSRSLVAEVGMPARFSGVILDPPSLFGLSESCGDTNTPPSAAADSGVEARNFSCTFVAPGVAAVGFAVTPASGSATVAATLEEPVAAPLALSVSSRLSADAGTSVDVSVNVTGGAWPIQVTGWLSGTETPVVRTVDGDGRVTLPFVADRVGSFVLSFSASDALGAVSGNATARLVVTPMLAVVANATASTAANATGVVVTGTVEQGTDPFGWAVVPSIVPIEESAEHGMVTSLGEFEWRGSFRLTGNLSVCVGVVDAQGFTTWTNLSLVIAAPPPPPSPPLTVSGTMEPVVIDSSTQWVLNVTLQGGTPPFTLWWNDTVGDRQTFSAPADGTDSWRLPVVANGTLDATLSVVDRLGDRARSNLSAVAPPAPPASPGTAPTAPPTPSPPSATADAGSGPAFLRWTVLAIGAAAFLGGWVVWHRRRRSRSAPAPEPDPVEVLRTIVAPADGVDRATVELLAEEAGVSLPTLRTTIDRLVAEGTLRSETDRDGEEVFAWSSEP